MGWWSKLKKGLQVAGQIAPILPIPTKAKTIIDKADDAVPVVDGMIDAVKTPTKPKP